MAWACMVANGSGSLLFIDDVTADRGGKMNSGGHMTIISALTSGGVQIQSSRATVLRVLDVSLL